MLFAPVIGQDISDDGVPCPFPTSLASTAIVARLETHNAIAKGSERILNDGLSMLRADPLRQPSTASTPFLW
jgi:hypothetical protein